MKGVVRFMGMRWQHSEGRHYTPFRCPHGDRGNIGVDVKDGQVVGAACLACGNTDFVVIVEGKDQFWPMPSANIIM